jgi:hypothetical protein
MAAAAASEKYIFCAANSLLDVSVRDTQRVRPRAVCGRACRGCKRFFFFDVRALIERDTHTPRAVIERDARNLF